MISRCSLTGSCAIDRAPRLRREHAEDAVGIADARDLGVGHDQRLVGEVHRQQCARLDAGRRIADDILEVHLGQVGEDLLDAVLGQRILVARLRGRQHEQLVDLLVLDQRLVQVGLRR